MQLAKNEKKRVENKYYVIFKKMYFQIRVVEIPLLMRAEF